MYKLCYPANIIQHRLGLQAYTATQLLAINTTFHAQHLPLESTLPWGALVLGSVFSSLVRLSF
jgi:hypothetical protein